MDSTTQRQKVKHLSQPAPQLGLKLLLNKRGEKVVKMHLEDGRTLFVNLKKLTQHKAQLVDTQQSSSLNSVDHSQH